MLFSTVRVGELAAVWTLSPSQQKPVSWGLLSSNSSDGVGHCRVCSTFLPPLGLFILH